MSETRQGVLPTPSAFPGSMCRRISITHWTWSLASSLGKLWLYSHCPKLNRMLTFCHLVSALCSEMTLKTQKLKKNHKHEKFKPDHMELFTPYKKVFEVGCNGTSAPHDGTKTIATNIALPPCTVKTQGLILCTLWLVFFIWKVYKSSACIMFSISRYITVRETMAFWWQVSCLATVSAHSATWCHMNEWHCSPSSSNFCMSGSMFSPSVAFTSTPYLSRDLG